MHLLLVDAHPGARPVPFASHKRPLQLVAHLDDEGRITDEGQAGLVGFVREAREFAHQHGAEDLLAFCTSAIRESANGEAVLARVTAETAVDLQELSGDQEAAVTFQAARRWYGWGAGSLLNLDIGGGSFEIAMGSDELPQRAVSVPLGAARLTREWLRDDPPSPQSITDLRGYIRSTLSDVVRGFKPLGRPDLVAGTSKTFRSLARIAGAAPSTAGPFARRQLHRSDLSLWARRLSAMSAEDRAGLKGISEMRSGQLLAGALVAEAALDLFRIDSIDICPWALREGLLLRRFDAKMFDAEQPLPGAGVGHAHLDAGASAAAGGLS